LPSERSTAKTLDVDGVSITRFAYRSKMTDNVMKLFYVLLSGGIFKRRARRLLCTAGIILWPCLEDDFPDKTDPALSFWV